jgi:regulatory protein
LTSPPLSLRARALKALTRREHSRQELRAKLQPFAEEAEQIEALLDELERRGWLSEARFIEQLTTIRRRKFGAPRILHELRQKGVSATALEAAQARLTAGEFEAAHAVWLKKFGKFPATAQEHAKQSRFLAGRGFSAEVVHRLLRGEEQ